MTNIIIIIGLILFEIVESADNAIINAAVLTKMSPKSRRWFLTWGLLIAVFLVRGLLPFVILLLAKEKILIVGGIFLVLIFVRWLLENSKTYLFLKEKINNRINIENDTSRLVYLEILDAVFSIDGVIGAFAFTMSIPLIIIGNGIGSIVVRQLTIYNIGILKKLPLLKNGAMYSMMFLGIIMILEGYNLNLPFWFSPLVTFLVIGFFILKSLKLLRNEASS